MRELECIGGPKDGDRLPDTMDNWAVPKPSRPRTQYEFLLEVSGCHDITKPETRWLGCYKRARFRMASGTFRNGVHNATIVEQECFVWVPHEEE